MGQTFLRKGTSMRLALFAIVLSAAPALGADSDKDYYPLKVGTKWTFKLSGQTEKFVLSAVKEEKVGTQDCVKVEARLGDQLKGSEHIAVLNDGVYRFKYGDQAIEPPVCFFRPSGKKGVSWPFSFKFGPNTATGKFEMDVEDVEVPAGKFPGAFVVRAEANEKPAMGEAEMRSTTTIWLAKHVGIVKQVITIGDTRITLELEKMEEPKN
jgi:hypothetical protein